MTERESAPVVHARPCLPQVPFSSAVTNHSPTALLSQNENVEPPTDCLHQGRTWGFLLTVAACSCWTEVPMVVIYKQRRRQLQIWEFLPPKPIQPLPTTRSLKTKKAEPDHLIRAIAAGCCSGLCLLCYLEVAQHPCPSC